MRFEDSEIFGGPLRPTGWASQVPNRSGRTFLVGCQQHGLHANRAGCLLAQSCAFTLVPQVNTPVFLCCSSQALLRAQCPNRLMPAGSLCISSQAGSQMSLGL